jgi:hypothetical protein
VLALVDQRTHPGTNAVASFCALYVCGPRGRKDNAHLRAINSCSYTAPKSSARALVFAALLLCAHSHFIVCRFATNFRFHTTSQATLRLFDESHRRGSYGFALSGCQPVVLERHGTSSQVSSVNGARRKSPPSQSTIRCGRPPWRTVVHASELLSATLPTFRRRVDPTAATSARR